MATDTRARMIETTSRLIQVRGYRGVSLGDILSESGAPRGSLYYHFPGGKDSLVLEAMREGIVEATRELESCLEQADTPAEGVRSFFRAAAREMVDTEYLFGCPVAPIILDTPDSESELARTCRAALDEWEQLYRRALESSGVESGHAARLARTILAGMEGALMIARSRRSAAPLEEVGDQMAEMVAAVTTER